VNLTDREKVLIVAAYASGYERGHNDTVESCYTDADDCAEDWLKDALDDGFIADLLGDL